jgi:hypothetical protein
MIKFSATQFFYVAHIFNLRIDRVTSSSQILCCVQKTILSGVTSKMRSERQWKSWFLYDILFKYIKFYFHTLNFLLFSRFSWTPNEMNSNERTLLWTPKLPIHKLYYKFLSWRMRKKTNCSLFFSPLPQ